VTRLRAAMVFAALTLEADLLAAVDAGRNGYVEHPSTIKSHTFCRAIRRLDKADGEAIGAVIAARPKDALACTSNTLEEFSKDMVVGFRFCRLRIRRSIACGRRFFLAIRSAKAALPLGSFSRQMFGFKPAARRFILELVIGGGHFLKARLLACRRTLSIRVQLLGEL